MAASVKAIPSAYDYIRVWCSESFAQYNGSFESSSDFIVPCIPFQATI